MHHCCSLKQIRGKKKKQKNFKIPKYWNFQTVCNGFTPIIHSEDSPTSSESPASSSNKNTNKLSFGGLLSPKKLSSVYWSKNTGLHYPNYSLCESPKDVSLCRRAYIIITHKYPLRTWLFFFLILLKNCWFAMLCSFYCTTTWLSYTLIYILFHIRFYYDLSQDIEYSSPCYTVVSYLSILYIIILC